MIERYQKQKYIICFHSTCFIYSRRNEGWRRKV